MRPGDEADSWDHLVDTMLGLYPISGRPVVFREGHVRCTHIAHGWLMRCLRNTRACLQLREAGMATEAAPLRRSTLEHATALAWLEDEGDAAVDPIHRGNVNYAERQREATTRAGWGLPEEAFRQAIEDVPQAANTHLDIYAHNFWERNAKYGTPHNLPVYAIESAQSHPSWTSASPYCQEGSEAGLVTLLDEPSDGELDEAAAAYVLVTPALVSFNEMLAGHDLTRDLRAILARGRELVARDMAKHGRPRPAEFDDAILPHLE